MENPAVVLVTGASRGLGRGVALELAKAGFSVAIHCGRNVEAAEEAQGLCRDAASNPAQRFEIVSGDIGVAADREALFAATLEKFGHLDALVNNAGITSPGRKDITEAREEDFDTVISVNLKGPFFLSQLAVGYWRENPDASRIPTGYKLVFVSSISSDTVSLNRGDYCISKAGLSMANQLWGARLAEEGIQTIEFRPGIMLTDMTSGVKDKYDKLIEEGLVPQKRWGTPEDTGKAVKAFLSGDFPFTTGDVLYIDGGFHLKRL